MKFVILNLLSVLLTAVLTFLSLFVYHPEINLIHKILIILLIPCLLYYTYYIHNTGKIERDIRWYSGSLFSQVCVFILLVWTAKLGAYKPSS